MGVKLCGYASDMTRNLISEKMSGLYKKVYGIVERAQKKAICAASPGLSAKDLDSVARKVIARSGYAKAFGHSLGHGVGLEIHEAPFASKKSDAVLKPGMVITIEPGIYLDGKLGVRIEDLVLITEQGCEILSIHYEN
jgi:Xaa-Pro aminopeptidase